MNGPAVSQADEPQEQWNRVHAQLLKSVADAQAKLLAGLNEVNDRLDAQIKAVPALTANRDKQIADLKVLIGQTQEAVHESHADLKAGIMALLESRRQPATHARPRRDSPAKPQRKQRR